MRPGRPLLAALLLGAAPALAAAQEDAAETGRREDPAGRYTLPTGAFDGRLLPQRAVEGRREMAAWSQPVGPGVTPLSVFEGLAEAIGGSGANILFRCAAEACGGFDFRSGIELLPPPEMYLDLAEFYVLGAETGTGDAQGLKLLVVSRTSSAVFWQVTELQPASVAPAEGLPSATPDAAAPEAPQGQGGLAATFDRDGVAVLGDVSFASGKSDLGPEPPESLAALAAYLQLHPGYRATIVGHSDSSGSAAGNMALSRRRAEAVRDMLVRTFGVAAGRLDAAGAGALAPRASNATEDGRRENRRVEAVISFD
ncbi:OmpA family protein [Mangrovicoccus sp. HB161399]|uniref:OmpA family protein n=1 Tax=Mangrovicoccus sp. HB161399 TaxID=2720392 RepID=UPI001551A140|nr:OmpA family protein [Mangrovicoccus sp. HB161399]